MAGEEPEWYQHINLILAETNEEINPTSSALQTSFVNRDESDLESGSEDEEGIEEHDDENENEGETTSSSTAAKKLKQLAKKLVAAVHQKRSQMRSNKQALSELARAMQKAEDDFRGRGKARRKKETRTTGRSGEKPKTRNRDSKTLHSSLCFKQPEQYPGNNSNLLCTNFSYNKNINITTDQLTSTVSFCYTIPTHFITIYTCQL